MKTFPVGLPFHQMLSENYQMVSQIDPKMVTDDWLNDPIWCKWLRNWHNKSVMWKRTTSSSAFAVTESRAVDLWSCLFLAKFWRCVTGRHCSLLYMILYYSNPTNPISTQPIHQPNFNQLWLEGELLCLVSLLLHVIHYSENSPQCYSLNLTRN